MPQPQRVRVCGHEGVPRPGAEEVGLQKAFHRGFADFGGEQKIEPRALRREARLSQVALRSVLKRNRRERRRGAAADVGRSENAHRIEEAAKSKVDVADVNGQRRGRRWRRRRRLGQDDAWHEGTNDQKDATKA
jgi:hypothetical protein